MPQSALHSRTPAKTPGQIAGRILGQDHLEWARRRSVARQRAWVHMCPRRPRLRGTGNGSERLQWRLPARIHDVWPVWRNCAGAFVHVT